MVKVNIKLKEDNVISLTMKGHADYADEGQDLVCAGASSIVVGMMNALDEMAPETCDFLMEKGHVNILVKKVCDHNQILLEALIYQLKTLQETYSQYITIIEQEV